MHNIKVFAKKWDGTYAEIEIIGRWARGEKVSFEWKGKPYTRIVKQRQEEPLYIMFKNWRFRAWADMERT